MASPFDPAEDHLTPKELHGLLGDLQEPTERRLLFHALARCETCREGTPGLLEMLAQGRLTPEASLPEIEVALSEAAASRYWDELRSRLEGLSPEERHARLLRDPRLSHWGLAVHLAELGLDAEPVPARRRAELATAAADGLQDDEPVPAEYLAELRAFAWAVRADALRRAGEEAEAEDAFDRALAQLDLHEEPADFLPFRSRVLALLARLREQQGRWHEALLGIDRALTATEAIHRPESATVARILGAKARLLAAAGSWEEALEVQEQAVRTLASENPVSLRRSLELDRLELLVRVGSLEEAEACLPCLQRSVDSAEPVGNAVADAARFACLEASVHMRRGRLDEAERARRRGLAAWVSEGNAREAAKALLDLARVVLARGRAGELKNLADRAGQWVDTLDPDRETGAVLQLFRAAVHWEGVGLEVLVEELRKQLDHRRP